MTARDERQPACPRATATVAMTGRFSPHRCLHHVVRIQTLIIVAMVLVAGGSWSDLATDSAAATEGPAPRQTSSCEAPTTGC